MGIRVPVDWLLLDNAWSVDGQTATETYPDPVTPMISSRFESTSGVTTAGKSPGDEPAFGYRTAVTDEYRIQQLLDVLCDIDCREILGVTSETALSATEIADTCGLALSSTYRKLAVLTEAGLLAERTRIDRDSKHPCEYIRQFTAVHISYSPRGALQLEVCYR